MLAKKHPRNPQRLAALKSYAVLDTPHDNDFDDIVKLAGMICETPIALISLVDEDRQWFKAEVGTGLSEMPIANSICAHAILHDNLTEIEDTATDERTIDNPVCCGTLGARFYAGVPLVTNDGLPLGTLCVLDTKPRRLNDLQRTALQTLAKQIMHRLTLDRMVNNQRMMQKEMDHRIKNSLQTISAMVRLQSIRSGSKELRDQLETISSRIDAVALLHEALYRSSEDESLELSGFMRRITDLLQSSLPENIKLELDCDPEDVDGKTASAISIIFNEFVINSAKHAFQGRDSGAIVVRIKPEGQHLAIICRDNGTGMNLKTKSGGLGTQIIDACARQLSSNAYWSSDAAGTVLKFTAPLSLEAANANRLAASSAVKAITAGRH